MRGNEIDHDDDKGKDLFERYILGSLEKNDEHSANTEIRSDVVTAPTRTIPKAFRGLTPGGTLPGAYSVNGPARGQLPSWADNEEYVGDVSGNTLDNTENDRVDEAMEKEQNAFKCRTKLTRSKHLRFFILLLLGIVIVVAIAIGITLNEVIGKSAPPKENYCDLSESQPNIQMQCECFQIIKVVSDTTLLHYGMLKDSLNVQEDMSLSSCDHKNMALLLLASMDISSMSTEQLSTRFVLNYLYLSWNGPHWNRNEGWIDQNSPDVCEWEGVTCKDGRLLKLDLADNAMKGLLFSEIGTLTSLVELNFEANKISGSIPSEIGNLDKLQGFRVASNWLVGPIPTEFQQLTNLSRISLSFNSLNGSLPIWNASRLTDLDAQVCKLSGTLPASQLGLMTGLGNLNLNENAMTGTIPTEIGLLTALTRLIIAENLVNGALPTHIGNLNQLEYLFVSFNKLSGILPTELGLLTQLTGLDIQSNKFLSEIPSEIGNCQLLRTFDATINRLSGTIPDTAFGQLTQLDILNLAYNKFTGTIPSDSTGGLCEIQQANWSDLIIYTDCSVSCQCCICISHQ